MLLRTSLTILALAIAGCAQQPPIASTVALSATSTNAIAAVRAAETAFAATMAARDLNAFASFLADDAVFINNGNPLRGKAAIVEQWKRFFVDRQAPFAWTPQIVELSDGGRLGYTAGPVTSPEGKVFATFLSTWQLKPDGRWQIVFDNGYPTCDCRTGK